MWILLGKLRLYSSDDDDALDSGISPDVGMGTKTTLTAVP